MRKQLDAFEAGFNRFNQLLAGLAAAAIGIFAILVPLNLLLVKTQLGSMPWLFEGAEYVFYVAVFLSSAWVLHKGAHVRIDVLTSALPPRAAARVEQGLDVVGAALCLVLCFYGVRAAFSEFEDGTLPDKDLRIDNWYMMTVFAVSFLLIAIEFLLRFRRAGRGEEVEEGVSTEAGF